MNLQTKPCIAVALALVCALATFLWLPDRPAPQTNTQRERSLESSAPTPLGKIVSNVGPAASPTPASLSPGDGKDLESIRKWAHNELEVERMVEENSRIIRRELVTFKETPAAVIERSRLTGEPVRELTLPGLDGQNVQFEITKSDVEPSGLRGMFSGRIAGQPDSLVTLAFARNKQAYTVLSPSAGIYLTADAHDAGDAILKSIQPDIYAAGYCGNP